MCIVCMLMCECIVCMCMCECIVCMCMCECIEYLVLSLFACVCASALFACVCASALSTWSCQRPRCCCYCWWNQSLNWNVGDCVHCGIHGNSQSQAGCHHQSHC